MTAQRIKGQEATIIITRDDVVEDTLTDIHNFNVEFEGEIKSQGYLGEKTNRKDDVFNGVKCDFEMHTHTQDWLRFLIAIHDRMKRNDPTLVVNITCDLLYPNLDNPSIFVPDAKFGPAPFGLAGRTEYGNVKIQGEADDYDVQFS
jgi:hypothetical protein